MYDKMSISPHVSTFALYCGQCNISYTNRQVPDYLCPICEKPLTIVSRISPSS